jgi:hypothetical protein
VTERDDAEALETAKSQTKAMETLAAEVMKLRKSGRRTWKFVLFDIALTIGLAFFAWIAHDASDSAAQARQATLATCHANNTSRAENLQIWNFLIVLSRPPASEPPAKRAVAARQLAMIQAEIDKTFAPRNCQALVNGKSP